MECKTSQTLCECFTDDGLEGMLKAMSKNLPRLYHLMRSSSVGENHQNLNNENNIHFRP